MYIYIYIYVYVYTYIYIHITLGRSPGAPRVLCELVPGAGGRRGRGPAQPECRGAPESRNEYVYVDAT